MGLVQYELRVQAPAGQMAPVVESILAPAAALHASEEMLGQDLVGVHVGPVQRRGQTAEGDEFLYGRLLKGMSEKYVLYFSSLARAKAWFYPGYRALLRLEILAQA